MMNGRVLTLVLFTAAALGVPAQAQDRAQELQQKITTFREWERGIEHSIMQLEAQLKRVKQTIADIEPYVKKMDEYIAALGKLHKEYEDAKRNVRGMWQSFCDGYNEPGGGGNVVFGFWKWDDKREEDEAKAQAIRDKWKSKLREINRELSQDGIRRDADDEHPVTFRDLAHLVEEFSPKKQLLEVMYKPEKLRLEASIERLRKEVEYYAGERLKCEVELRRVQAVREQPQPQRPPKKPRVGWKVVDPQPSNPVGEAPRRRCIWRFFIELEETNDAPVELKLTELTFEPTTQVSSPDRRGWPAPPAGRYTLRVGETVELGGWMDTSSGTWLLSAKRLLMEGAGEDSYRPAPSRRRFGPFYLTVWEKDGFAGRCTAVFESTRPVAGQVRAEVAFAPQPPKWAGVQATIPMDVQSPRPDELAGVWLVDSRCLPGIVVEVEVPDLPPGVYRLRVHVEGVGDRYIWARLKQGRTRLRFSRGVPVPLGPFKITLSTPELPQVQPAELAGRIKRYDGEPTQKTINNLMKQIRKTQAQLAEPEPTGREPRPVRGNQRDLANSYNYLAYKYCNRGEFDKGRAAADQALSLFDAAGAANEPVSGITGYLDAMRANILRTQIRAAYHLGMAGELRRLRPELADNLAMSAGQHAEKGYTLSASTLYMDAAGSCWALAEELLVLGVVDPNGARAVWEEGIPHARKAGAESIKYPDWWPR